MGYKFFDKKSAMLADKSASCSGIKNKIKMNEQLAEELPKPIIKKCKKRKVYPSFKDNIQGVGFADIQSLSKLNKGIRFVLCVIDSFSKNE